MKKIISIALFLLFFVGTLTACGIENSELESSGETFTSQTSIVQIALAYDELLDRFDDLHEFDYRLIREAHGIADPGYDWGDSLVIWADRPLRDLAVIRVGNDFIDDELFFIPISTFGQIDELLPGQALVIHQYVGLGTLPWSGITFIDENDKKRYFTMIADQSVGMEPNIWDANIIEAFDDNGKLQVAIHRDGGFERQYITITLDENGQFDPEQWAEKNRHLWFLFHLLEFENRTEDLPADWKPWW